ncbi:MAG: ABC transporter permease [Gudongella sp.]|nr:ABC transporter permease [Gudongella sp.]
MLRVVKSELLKWFSGKMIYISMIITAFLVMVDYFAARIFMKTSSETIPGLTDRLNALSAQEYMVNSMVNLISGGSIFIIVTIIIATLITEDYGRGTMKYSLLAVSRRSLITGKIASAGILVMMLVLSAAISSGMVGLTAYGWSDSSHSAMEVLTIYALTWLTLYGFSSLLIFAIGRISKLSGAIALGIGIFMATGLVGVFAPESIKRYIIGVDFHRVANLSSVYQARILTNGLIYILLFAVLSIILFRRKEIVY